ncbi:hypothetical protein G7046_g7764 [Stylonectria norvegica]|nr:hypothetical protein G7046_g7764 [Stylonectria norvegica]
MNNVGIVLIVVFLLLVIMGPIACATFSREKKAKVYNPQPEQLGQARRKLSTVTTTPSVSHRINSPANADADIEVAVSHAEFGECPICIGPLIPEPAHAFAGDRGEDCPRPSLKEVVTVTAQVHPISSNHGNQNVSAPAVGLEDAARGSRQDVCQDIGASAPDTSDDDILTLNSCGHSFHSKCLSSWFLINRHDCPVCRVPYYKSHGRRPRTLAVQPFY